MLEFDHIGIGVPGFREGRRLIEAGLPVVAAIRSFDDPVLRESAQFCSARSGRIFELLAPRDESNSALNG